MRNFFKKIDETVREMWLGTFLWGCLCELVSVWWVKDRLYSGLGILIGMLLAMAGIWHMWKVLDTALILHMEHGGGNNSTFTTRVVTSTGSDTYSTIAAAMSSLKGPKHGGANIKVTEMIEDIRSHVSDISDREEVAEYLRKILRGEAFDRKGLIYGMGHAIYTVSDPRERIFRQYVEKLAVAKGREEDMRFFNLIEELAPALILEINPTANISPNVDFYSGFVYEMLDIPKELYTAIFAVARIVGWSAHRIEELVTTDKIIRPAYMSVMPKRDEPVEDQDI